MPKASIIVPVYQVEDYLEQCVQSILAQTEADFELIFVDDGSPDNCGAMCDRLAQTDARIQVIHQENQGLGAARNTGIQAASGDWLLLVDSDDWIEPQLLEKALEAGVREEADIVLFAFRSVDDCGKTYGVFSENIPQNQALDPKTHKELLLCAPSSCNKLYRRSFFLGTGLAYPSRVWYEDLRTTPKLMAKAKRVTAIDYVGYNYLRRQGSIMRNANLGRNVEIIQALEDLLAWFRQEGLMEEYHNELEFLALYHVYLTSSVRVLRADPSHPLLKQFAAYMQDTFPAYSANPYRKTQLSRSQQLALALVERRLYALTRLLFQFKGQAG